MIELSRSGNMEIDNKELIRTAARPLMIALMILSSAAMIGTGMTGTPIVDSWCYTTLGLVVEWAGERVVLKKLGKA